MKKNARRCPSRTVRLAALFWLLVGAGSASAQWLFTPDVTVEASGVTLTPRDVITDLGAGPLLAAAVSGLPEGVALAAIHADANGDWLYVPAITVELPGPVYASRRDVVRDAGGSVTIELEGSTAGIPPEAALGSGAPAPRPRTPIGRIYVR